MFRFGPVVVRCILFWFSVRLCCSLDGATSPHQDSFLRSAPDWRNLTFSLVSALFLKMENLTASSGCTQNEGRWPNGLKIAIDFWVNPAVHQFAKIILQTASKNSSVCFPSTPLNNIRLQILYFVFQQKTSSVSTGVPNLGYICVSEGVHLRLAIEGKKIFTCCLF